MPPSTAPRGLLTDARGLSQLAVDAVVGVTDVVEALHRAIRRLAPPVEPGAPSRTADRTRGLTGFVYRRVRGTTRAVGLGVDVGLAGLGRLLDDGRDLRSRDALVAALNGVVGDHLAATGNPLAVPMHLRHGRRPLTFDPDALAARCGSGDRLLVLAHGLCMSDLDWTRDGHDHGAALARDLGWTPLYLRYNSGLPVAQNGRALATLLDELATAWPLPIREIALVGHSMGGLVVRSACHHATVSGSTWLPHVRRVVSLGTPHHGAPLERAGQRVDRALGVSPYTAPFARLGLVRSAGIRDLHRGTILDRADPSDCGSPIPLPDGVEGFALAAATHRPGADGIWGDGLVPLDSALAQIDGIPSMPLAGRSVHRGLSHFDLLGSPAVYDQLRRWLA